MTKTRELIEKELDANIPRDAVSSRSGGGPKQLSYLETWYVIDRLNKVFGNLGWDCETVEMVQVNATDGLPAYRAKVRITVSAPAYDADGVTLVGFRNVVREGTGWGSDKIKMNAHEMACKEAESDALKRAAMKLGISMGLGLYDKSGEYVEDAPKSTQKFSVALDTALQASIDSTKAQVVSGEIGGGREALNKRITAMSKVVIAKRLKTIDELKADLKSKYGVDSTQALSDVQAKELLANLEGQANG